MLLMMLEEVLAKDKAILKQSANFLMEKFNQLLILNLRFQTILILDQKLIFIRTIQIIA
jgi:hypothetical protein